MGRKSLASERKAEILDAFERCVVRYGLEGASLEQIAEEAKMKRSILRHYIGNRDELIEALIERIVTNYRAELEKADASVASIPAKYYLSEVLDHLFKVEGNNKPQDKIILDVLLTAKDRYPRAKVLLTELFNALVDSLAKDLIDVYPKADEAQCQGVAYSIICLSMTNESMMWLGLNPQYNAQARANADALLKTLEGK